MVGVKKLPIPEEVNTIHLPLSPAGCGVVGVCLCSSQSLGSQNSFLSLTRERAVICNLTISMVADEFHSVSNYRIHLQTVFYFFFPGMV